MKPFSPVFYLSCLSIVLSLTPQLRGEEAASSAPTPIPSTRPAVKQALEALKHRQARLPLPPLTDEERQQKDGRPRVNNGRMAAYYLPASWRQAKWGRDPNMTLDYAFTVECFWIVSRANNCHY